jgi:hypothetical protein
MGVDSTEAEERELIQIASETLLNMRTVRSLGAENFLREEYNSVLRQLEKEGF